MHLDAARTRKGAAMCTSRCIRLPVGLWMMALAISASPAFADPVAPPSSPGDGGRTCVEVEIAGERTPDYACLSDALRGAVAATRPVASLPTVGRQPGPNAVGLITPTEVRQQYGPNFGTSVVPYRPVAPRP